MLRLVVDPTLCSMVHYPLCLPPASSNKMLTHKVWPVSLNEGGLHLVFMHGLLSVAKDPIHYSARINKTAII